MGKIPTKAWEKCRETSERKAETHSYNDLVDLLIELAMERENDSHMDKYLHRHLRRETPAEKSPGERSPQLHSNPRKARGGQLKHMKETHPSDGKGAPNLFYCHPTHDEGGPCHLRNCARRSACLLELQGTQKTKDGQEVKHQDHFPCTITCRYWGKRRRRHYEDECHIKSRKSEKLKKADEERCKNAGKGKPDGEAKALQDSLVRVTLVEDEGPQPPQLFEQEHPIPPLRMSSWLRSALSPRPPALAAPKRTRTPKGEAQLALQVPADCLGGCEVP